MLGPMMASVEDERHSVINDLSAMSMEEEISMEPLNNLSIVNQHDNNNRQKSAISLVHECALQMRMVVVFEVRKFYRRRP